MDYVECMSKCMSRADIEPIEQGLYREYPVPDAGVWERCVEEATVEHGSPVSAFDCMARYEVVLEQAGVCVFRRIVTGHFAKS